MRKIIRIEEPPKKDRSHWSVWTVYIDFGTGKEVMSCMREDEFKILMKEEELIKKGYSLKDLLKYKELVTDYAQFEESLNSAGAEI